MASFAGALSLPGGLALRFTQPGDENFLLELFIMGRPWLALGSPDRELIRHLYEEQQRITRHGMGQVYPEHLDFIIDKSGQAVGHLVLDFGYNDWRITQLEIHELGQGKGIGSDVLRGVQGAAERMNIPLTVATPMILTRAIGFYRRQGFVVAGQNPPMLELVWLPPARRGLLTP